MNSPYYPLCKGEPTDEKYKAQKSKNPLDHIHAAWHGMLSVIRLDFNENLIHFLRIVNGLCKKCIGR